VLEVGKSDGRGSMKRREGAQLNRWLECRSYLPFSSLYRSKLQISVLISTANPVPYHCVLVFVPPQDRCRRSLVLGLHTTSTVSSCGQQMRVIRRRGPPVPSYYRPSQACLRASATVLLLLGSVKRSDYQ
jgi:hypothetical protein